MKLRIWIASMFCVVPAAFATHPAAPPCYPLYCQKILIPVLTAGTTAGANGSLWIAAVTVQNRSDLALRIFGSTIAPKSTAPIPIPFTGMAYGGGIAGGFIDIPRGMADAVSVSERVQDLSRAGSTWGTDIPTVRSEEFRATPIELLDVPLGRPGFRQTLRVYGFATACDQRCIVATQIHVWEQSSDGDREVYSEPLVMAALDHFSGAYLLFQTFIGDLAGRFNVKPEALYRVEISPTDATTRVWAFVSVTHNESQHVTVIVPR